MGVILELFSCSGGMAEGLRRAGIEVTVAFDHDADACASYAKNLGHAPVRMDVHALLSLVVAGWRPGGPIDLIVADPPCAPWSLGGKRRGLNDKRDMIEPTMSLIGLLLPAHFLVANVPGLDSAPTWPIVQRLIGGLSRCGYCIDYASLDAADYGVPQHRVRPFWFGHRRGTDCIAWPARTHGSPEEAARPALFLGERLRPWVTCREALGHLPAEEIGSPVRLRWRGSVGAGRKPRASHVDAVAGTITARENQGDGSIVFSGAHRPSDPDRPSRTLTQNTHGDGAMLQCPRSRPPSAVKLSERAAAILQGFPEDWHFAGKTKRARWAQIGMAMPPPFAAAVGRSVAAAMGRHAREEAGAS